ncbi:long-chain-fatty-acid--CoA ligase [Nocardioides insulae]|uniref:long-chain-fatty-acid--CoA ligase n=1 Tax=Nocardioides insulae TaxID=394734 RepID=UPI000407CEAD|nr:long-chain-fatty-acid--CoA ligase [Nocardioides insulae]
MTQLPHRPLTWVTQVSRHAHEQPGRAAIVFGDRTTSWRELEDRSRRLGSVLRERGVRAGDRVALLMTNRPEFVETLLATHLLGAVLVPINFRLVSGEVDFLLRDSGARVVLADADTLDVVRGTSAATEGLEVVVAGVPENDLTPAEHGYEAAIGSVAPCEGVGAEDLAGAAFIMYTSGTTGLPKGAVLTFANLLTQSMTAMQVLQLVDDDQVAALTSPLFHIASVGHLIPSLMLGHTMILVPSGRFDPDRFIDLLERHRVTGAFLVPSMWELVCRRVRDRTPDLALRSLAWGAEPARLSTLQLMADTFPDASIVSSFGQTEMSPITLIVKGRESRERLGSVGRPVAMVEVRVVDAAMNDVPVGEVGEIVYRGPGTTVGYWNAPEATERAFAGGWFHSGDLVRRDADGYFYVVDRLKDMIISGGENIYSAELEQVLGEHPDVSEIAVVGAPDPRWGETPVAVVVPAPGRTVTIEDLHAYAEDRVAPYKRPSRVVCVDRLPRNASGKILKAPLREVAAAPAEVH